MRVQTLVKLVAAILVFTILVCTLIVVMRYLGKTGKDQQTANTKLGQLAPKKESPQDLVEIAELRKKLRSKNTPEIVLGLPAFAKARRMLEAGKFSEARVLLEEIVHKYENSPAETEAYRILGEMNMDDLFAIKPGDGKIHYTVKSGDSYLAIARHHKTNFDLMMMLNGLTRTDRLRPKDKLVLMPLDFSLLLEPRQNQLFLLDKNGKVLKLYEPIVDMTIPRKEGIVETRIERVLAYASGHKVNPTLPGYRGADKIIQIRNPNIQIRGESKKIPKNFHGIVLKKSDIEELVLLLRSGNSVKIRY